MRPKRLFVDSKSNRPYYIINKKKVFIKVPKDVSMRQLQKVNIKNIINLSQKRRVKKKTGKRIKALLEKKIISSLKKYDMNLQGDLQPYIFQEGRVFPELATAGRKPSMIIPVSTTIPLEKLDNNDVTIKELQDIRRLRTIEKLNAEDAEDNLKKLEQSKKFIEKGNIPKEQIKTVSKETKEKLPTIEPLFKEGEFPTAFLKSVKEKEQKGKGNDNDGLYNDEIEKITEKRLKHFVPCIPADKTQDLMKYVGKNDKEFAFIINTNPSNSDGSGEDGYRPGHWTAIYIDNRDDYQSCEYFDPLAEGRMPKAVLDIMRKIAKRMNPEKMFKFKQNMIRRQSLRSNHCGYFCIKFIEDRFNGESFCEASGYDDFVKDHEGGDGSKDGENDLKKNLSKYNSYI